MQYQRLGKSGHEISRICLGTMMFGGHAGEPEANAIIARAREDGGDSIDTAASS